MKYNAEFGDLTDERREQILRAMQDGDSHGYDLRSVEHRYFFVEKFFETDFKKITPRAPMGTRVFDLSQVLALEELPDTENIAALLKAKTWG